MLKKGTKVKIIAGDDKGKTGEIVKVFPGTNQVLIEGINIKSKHVKAKSNDKKGEIVKKAMPIHSSNVKAL